MNHRRLHFAFASTEPDLRDVTVYQTVETTFLDAPVAFHVIGSSHYVSAPAYDFFEVCSCERIGGNEGDGEDSDDGNSGGTGGAVRSLALVDGDHPETRRFAYENDHLHCETTLSTRPLDAFPADDDFDVAYTFAEEAVTAITVADDYYETYHTYPEHDLTVYTRNEFAVEPAARRRASDHHNE
jgi:hypothetical protein